MGVGDGLSSQAEADFLTSERKREEWEYDNVRSTLDDALPNIIARTPRA